MPFLQNTKKMNYCATRKINSISYISIIGDRGKKKKKE